MLFKFWTNSSQYILTTSFLQTQKVAQTLPQGLAPSVLPYGFTVSHYANGVVWHSCFCPLLTSCSKSNFEGLGEFFSCWYTKEPSVWLLWNSVLYLGLSMSYSKTCVKIDINSFPNNSHTFIVQVFSMFVCMYIYTYVFSTYKVFLSLLPVGNHG